MRRWVIACASVLAVPVLALTLSLVPASAQTSTGSQPTPVAPGSPVPGGSATGQGAGGVQGDPANGQTLFGQTCATCHGSDLTGGVGPRLNPIEHCGNTKDPLSPAYLTDVITNGLQGAPCTTGQSQQMPKKGGNSSLTDKDINDLVAFILQQNRSTGPQPLSVTDLARENVKWVTLSVLAMLILTWLLARYNMRWIARRVAARRERLERQGRL